jgi:hypothetical protein
LEHHFPELLNVHEFNDIKQTDEPPVPELSVVDGVMAVGKMKE